jgi:hypothetical protein
MSKRALLVVILLGTGLFMVLLQNKMTSMETK